jgi:hypothetical protein
MISLIIKYRNIILPLIIGAVAVLAFFRYQYVVKENKRLRDEIIAANSTIVKLDKKIELEGRINDNATRLRNRIRGHSDDTEVPPVINDIIDSIGGLQDNGE